MNLTSCISRINLSSQWLEKIQERASTQVFKNRESVVWKKEILVTRQIRGVSESRKEPEIRSHINKCVDSITSFASIEPRENPALQKVEDCDGSVTYNEKMKELGKKSAYEPIEIRDEA